MGRTIVNDQFVIDRATNAITVLPHAADDAIACLRCGRCSDHCPAGSANRYVLRWLSMPEMPKKWKKEGLYNVLNAVFVHTFALVISM